MQGTDSLNTVAVEVRAQASSLNSEDSFVLATPSTVSNVYELRICCCTYVRPGVWPTYSDPVCTHVFKLLFMCIEIVLLNNMIPLYAHHTGVRVAGSRGQQR